MLSFPTGNKIEGNTDVYAGSLCEFALVVDKICVKLTYTENSTTKFVECKMDQKCKYNYSNGNELLRSTLVFEKNCDCGFNAEGKGYCPLPHSAGI
jgi:hypothetical protein